ncbi:molybdenum cofactor guanylyltransferase [Micromonospora andamanensis]|uniref:molybdenum cofactor guanylyltransferase n=1 Tax=Micromonospora andamanensis TaxID=1287068 RepID=UPI00194F74F1|nr:NTP transferase domain-containing protein [Micromonospora andamanensis]
MTAYAAVVLSGGAGRRMGGRDKPVLPVGGVPMRERVLAAVADASPRILVGPGPAIAGVRLTREVPPGGGPVAAVAAGLALLDTEVPAVALLAADLPLLTRSAIGELLDHLHRLDGVCYVDRSGRRQTLCGVWRPAALRAALDRLSVRRGGDVSGAPLRELVAGLAVRDVTWRGDGPEPWFDCDTERDLRRAEEWTR